MLSSSANHNSSHGVGADFGGTSLAQLMSEHKTKVSGGVQPSYGLALPALSSLTAAAAPSSSMSITSSQNSLSLGTLASLNMSSHSSAPSLLSVPLSSLSLNSSTAASTSSSLAAPPGFGSLNSVLQSNPSSVGVGTGIRATLAVPKGGPSLADLIQEHSNRSPTSASSCFPPPRGSVTSAVTPGQTLSLSELASQHQNRNTQSQPADPCDLSKADGVPAACLAGRVSLSQLALQHQSDSSSVSPTPVGGTEPPANALKQTFGISEPPRLSHLAPAHKGKTSTTSNGSHSSSASPLLPAKPERAGAATERAAGCDTQSRGDRKLCHPGSGSARPGQTIDLSALMAQSEGASPRPFDPSDPTSPSFPSPFSSGPDSSVFAEPSVFAITLSVRSRRQNKRCRKGKRRTESSYRALLCGWQDASKEQQVPLSPIAPFRFDTPSPDDVVRAKQKKAFTR